MTHTIISDIIGLFFYKEKTKSCSFFISHFFTFNWNLPIEPKAAYIVVYDILGNEVSKISTAKIFDQKTIDVESWGSGIYSYALFSHGVKLGNGKFTVH